MKKLRKDNDVLDRTSPLYVKNGNEISWPIKKHMVYDKDHIG